MKAAATELAAPQGAIVPAGLDPEMGKLMAIALEKGAVEGLERLVALSERTEDRRAAQEFGRAKAEFQANCPPILKNRETDYTTKAGGRVHYAYATLDQIASAIGPALHPLGLSYSWDAKVANGVVTVVCTLRHANGHRETATFEAAVDRESKMNPVQQVGAALTYGKRYSLLCVLGLTSAEDDTDGIGGGPGPGAPADTITESQAADLTALAQEAKADLPKFLAWLGVSAIEEIPASRYGNAVKALQAKRGGAK